MPGLPTQDPGLAKNYEEPVVRHNQSGCIRNFTLNVSATFHIN